MHPDDALVPLVGLLAHGISNGVRQPAGQVLPNGSCPGVESESALPVDQSLREFRRYLLARLAVQCPALATLRRVHGVLRAPTAILAPGDAALAVAALAHA